MSGLTICSDISHSGSNDSQKRKRSFCEPRRLTRGILTLSFRWGSYTPTRRAIQKPKQPCARRLPLQPIFLATNTRLIARTICSVAYFSEADAKTKGRRSWPFLRNFATAPCVPRRRKIKNFLNLRTCLRRKRLPLPKRSSSRLRRANKLTITSMKYGWRSRIHTTISE